jgi:nucleotide-binding universal stress UspA family protein
MEILFGHLRNTRFGESVGAKTPPLNPPAVPFPLQQPQAPGPSRVRNLLLPLNGSAASLAAVDQLIADPRRHAGVCVHLLHVAPRLPRHVTRFLGGGARTRWLQSRAEAAVAPAAARLARAGIEHRAHARSGQGVAATIIAVAATLDCERVVMGATRKSDIVRLFTGSITGRVLARSPVPVEVVLHGESSLITRLGVPVGVGLALFALVLEID